jgi:hypothetical protein
MKRTVCVGQAGTAARNGVLLGKTTAAAASPITAA